MSAPNVTEIALAFDARIAACTDLANAWRMVERLRRRGAFDPALLASMMDGLGDQQRTALCCALQENALRGWGEIE